ncbi:MULTISPECIES: metal ABC transporter substrate-binding protein [Cyanophyceae]|uniref:metal ABC transporter substrate-binding protein n=1 Tax=Cyanophyceae TaxID=3028117 RepID=UPI00016DCC18|nr:MULTISPECIES: metal ABC transporter substrate-binding protein [Cyanophyceae]ACA99724.1 periplasmic solute binding protein family [Picosynechococcus sp. PCC 7002]SMH56515.1 manganese transport system substrate-binding protein [Picosynechococcus sp. OG1]SMQ83438.1 manganese transport system substrate-binding protein [Synechococcus sp. 7002]
MIRINLPRQTLSLVGIVCGIWLVGCTQQAAPPVNSDVSTNNETTVNDTDRRKKVLTTFTVIADIAQNVAGDKLIVESITRIGAEIHGYEPTPSDLVRAQDADLLLYNGMNLERWFEQFLGNLNDVPAVIVTEGIEPIPIAEGPYTDKPNPHAWMSPKNALVYVENIRQAFVALDPDNAATYNANAAAYSAELEAIAAEFEADLNLVPAAQRFLVSCEGAFSYLAQDYGLEEIYIWPINAEQQFTPKQVQSVITQVEANDVPTIFCESTVSDEGQKEVAKATGARFGGNLYVDSLSTPDGPVPTFLDLLEYDVRTIANGLLAGTAQ